MAEKKTNRRTQKTQKAIFEALAELLCEKELTRITINELTEKADIHRATFYKHFLDIFDVYEKLEQNVLREIGLLITEYGEKTTFEVYPVVFNYIKENPKIFKMVFSPHITGSLYRKLLKMTEGLNRMIWAESLGVNIQDNRVLLAIRYHSNGCLAIIAGWVLSDFAQPQDMIIKTLSGLDNSTKTYLSSILS